MSPPSSFSKSSLPLFYGDLVPLIDKKAMGQPEAAQTIAVCISMNVVYTALILEPILPAF